MKQRLFILTGLILWVLPARAALRFGLGDAVAKRSADLINQAGANTAVVGDNVAATLPSCPSGAVLDSYPTEMAKIGGIDPLGHVQPTGHTFPSDHIYYYSSTNSVVTPSVFAPGSIHVTGISASTYLNAVPVFTDYSVTFYPCSNLRFYYGHVRTLSSPLVAQLSATTPYCSTYSTGGSNIQYCSYYTNFVMNSGDLIGAIQTNGSLDFGGSDDRTSIFYVSPARRGPTQLDTICPIDYFTSSLKATMQAKLGRFDGGYQRVTPPICGTIAADVANTAKGYWYHPGSPDNPEDPHLSLIDNNVYAPQQTISVGNSLPNGGGQWYIFTTASSGVHPRDFSQVTADGNIYCYDTFFDPLGQSIPLISAPIYILQMTSSTTLRFEKQTSVGCGAGPWAFSGNAVTFQR